MDIVAPELQELAGAAERFCGQWVHNDSITPMLVIVGGFGSGKTHTARAIYRFCSSAAMNAFDTKNWGGHKYPESMFISWPEACNDFNDKNFNLILDAVGCELVVLDDIGAENDPWKVCSDKLCQILSRREKMFTVITTNIHPAEWPSKFDGRINDRLLRYSVVVDISKVPSYALR